MKTFEGLKEGTVLYSKEYNEYMTVHYSSYWQEDNTKEICFATERCLHRGCEFDPRDWEIGGLEQ